LKAWFTLGILIVIVFAAVAVMTVNLPALPRSASLIAAPATTSADQIRNATKSALSQLEEQSIQAARQAPAPSAAEVSRKMRQLLAAEAPDPVKFVPIPNGVRAGAGAIVQVPPPFSGSQYHIENTWYTDSADAKKRTFAFAGNIAGPGGEPTSEGVVVVQVLQYVTSSSVTALKMQETHTFTTTLTSGSLHVTGADGVVITLQNPTGTIVRFDVNARKFNMP
jgi:hypothetical protein